MTIEEVRRALDAEVLCGADKLGRDIKMVYASDLMSDVLAFARPRSLLLTGLTNLHVVLTAEMAELAAVCLVRGKSPDEDTIRMAEEKDIPLLRTDQPMFSSCNRLHTLGLSGHPAAPGAVSSEGTRQG